MLCGDLNGKEIQEREDVCIADSLWCTEETKHCKATIMKWIFKKKWSNLGCPSLVSFILGNVFLCNIASGWLAYFNKETRPWTPQYSTKYWVWALTRNTINVCWINTIGGKCLTSVAVQRMESLGPQFPFVCFCWGREDSLFFRSDVEPGARPSSFQRMEYKWLLGGWDFICDAEHRFSGRGNNNSS